MGHTNTISRLQHVQNALTHVVTHTNTISRLQHVQNALTHVVTPRGDTYETSRSHSSYSSQFTLAVDQLPY